MMKSMGSVVRLPEFWIHNLLAVCLWNHGLSSPGLFCLPELTFTFACRDIRGQRPLKAVVLFIPVNPDLPCVSCSVISNPMDSSPLGSTVYGILQARILEWVAIPFLQGIFLPRDQIQVPHFADRFFTIWATKPSCSPSHRSTDCQSCVDKVGFLEASRKRASLILSALLGSRASCLAFCKAGLSC